MRDTTLFHNSVGGVAGFDLPVHREVSPTYGAVPDIVISFPVAHEVAAIEGQNIPDRLLILRHYIASLSQRSETMRN